MISFHKIFATSLGNYRGIEAISWQENFILNKLIRKRGKERIHSLKRKLMKWKGREGSENIEDRRGKRIKRVGGGLGAGAILLLIFSLLVGEDPAAVLEQLNAAQGEGTYTDAEYVPSEKEAILARQVSVVLKETEDVWNEIFREQLERPYEEVTLVLFSESDRSACGFAQAATGPFYCPADRKVYIDLSFYDQLSQRFGAPGEFAMAYVVAHEVAHHVQNLLGITRAVEERRGRVNQKDFNDLSVRLELQADFLAGVWAHHAHRQSNFLDRGDIEEALRAANAIGDDRIQMSTRGYIVPDSFTHGTSEQRKRWFTLGIRTGDITQGDTFSANDL